MDISDNQTVDTGLQEFVSARTMQEQSRGLTLLLKRMVNSRWRWAGRFH